LEVNKSDIDYYLDILKNRDHPLLLTTLFYIEELLLLNPSFMKYFNDSLISLSDNLEEATASKLIVYLMFRFSDDESGKQIFDKIHSLKNFRQALWWGVAFRESRTLDSLLLEDIKEWEDENVLENLKICLPLVTMSNKVFLKVFKKILALSTKILPSNLTRYIFGNLIDNRLLYLDWSMMKSLDCGNNTFTPFHGYEYVNGIDVLNIGMGNKLDLSSADISELIQNMKQSKSYYFKELSDELLLELGQISITSFSDLLDEDTSLYMQYFLLRHFELLDIDKRIYLLRLMLNSSQD
ncbi:unnamed protein product, partial [marine sediment metagenome]